MLYYIKDFDAIKRGLIFCLLGSDCPILESLNPNFNDQCDALPNQFEGMSSTPFTYEQYEVTRRRLVEYINDHLTPTDKGFYSDSKTGRRIRTHRNTGISCIIRRFNGSYSILES